jgi:hypothetical protein
MSHASFAPCPHCRCLLSFLHGVAGSSMTPACPRCGKAVPVTRKTFLMRDHSRPGPGVTPGKPVGSAE